MIEKDFQVQLTKGLRAQGAYVYKIPDLAQAVTKPFDLVIAHDMLFWPTEAKLKKIKAKRGLVPETVILQRSDFRPHQLPTLLEIYEMDQGHPWIAVCAIVESLGRIIQRRAWMVPASIYGDQRLDQLTLQDMEDYGEELVWKPGLGWICPWLPEPF